jgi:hypothetical protein
MNRPSHGAARTWAARNDKASRRVVALRGELRTEERLGNKKDRPTCVGPVNRFREEKREERNYAPPKALAGP